MSQTFIKIMSGQKLADDHHNKEYTLLALDGKTKVSFFQKPEPHIQIGAEEVKVTGNVYVMNSQGKTISTFTPKLKLVTTDEPSEGNDLPQNDDKIKDEFVGARFTSNAFFSRIGQCIFLSEPGSGKTFASKDYYICDNRVSYLNMALKNIVNRNIKLGSILDPETKMHPNFLTGDEQALIVELHKPELYDFELLGLYKESEIEVDPAVEGRGSDVLVEVKGKTTLAEIVPYTLPFPMDDFYDAGWVFAKKDDKFWLVSTKDTKAMILHPVTL